MIPEGTNGFFVLKLLSCLDVLGVSLAPCGEAAFQGVNLGHVIAQSSQDIGGSLCVTLAGVANQDQVLVQATGSDLHGSNTGSAFVRNLIYEICGWEQFQTMEADYDTVKAAIEPALEYLRQLNPYLWNGGKTFPDSFTTVDAMFVDGELVMGMTYIPFLVATNIENGTFTGTTQTFIFDKGTIGNTNYMAIAANSPNKAGAMVVINAIISGQIQLTQYAELRELPVVATEKLSTEEKVAFDAVDLGQGVLSQAELLAHRLPEMPASLVPIIEQIWLNEVVGK